MAEQKLVRLRNRTTGVVVKTTEENATRLSDFESAESKTTKKTASSSKSSSK